MSRIITALALAGALAATTAVAENLEARYSSPYLASKPSAGADHDRRLEPGEAVRVIDRDGRWVRVRTRAGETGWVRRNQLR